ncbi:hypothetical protein ES705_16871 [subsurface metagenome]
MSDWDGQSKGNVLGYKIFIFILRYIHIRVAYFIVWFVALYYYFSTQKKDIRFFYKQILHYDRVKSESSIFLNYVTFGKVLLDKIAILAGFSSKYTYDYEGEQHLHKMANEGKGGIIIGAHAGNWEIAGHLLTRINRPVHVLIYDGERSNLKELMEDITGEKSFDVIPVRDNDMLHIYEIKKALDNGDIIAMHGDRFRSGTKTHQCNFLGRQAKFPLGPYYLATQFNVPFCFVYTMKETNTHYHFSSTPPMNIDSGNKKNKNENIKLKTELYASELEKMIRKYPLQWFNYYNFWNT